MASSLRQDLFVGIRMLIRHPFLTGAAVLSLALGIGANTANFSIFYGVLVRELPFERAGGLVFVGKRVADRLWAGEDPIGRRVLLPETGNFRVIGLAPDLQYEEFGEDLEGARLQLHFPYGVGAYRGMAVLVRATGDPGRLIMPVREELARIDPSLAPYDILTMPERRAFTTWEQELFGKSFAIFGGIALLLALCGIYGVNAYSVASRTREIGIRIALGARPGGVQSQVVGDALALAGIGVGPGLIVSLAFARALRGIVFGVSTADPLVFAGTIAAMLVTAVAAGWLPAQRAARVGLPGGPPPAPGS